MLTESELYRELGALTRNKDKWEGQIPYVVSLLASGSTKIRAKALWLLGEMGLEFPNAIASYVSEIALFCNDTNTLLRARAITALGRIGRSNYHSVEPYWVDLFRFASDSDAPVRLSFIWASENIAVNTPDPYAPYMEKFAALLHDPDEKVRMEAPKIFRVLGKRRPEFVKPWLELLQRISETDNNHVVRIHCSGAIKAAAKAMFQNI